MIKLKRKTGIEHWNVLCRWGVCTSLANPSQLVLKPGSPDSNIEMSWKVFAGPLGETLPPLIALRAKTDGVALDRDNLAAYFKGHLERGIASLQSIDSLTRLSELHRK